MRNSHARRLRSEDKANATCTMEGVMQKRSVPQVINKKKEKRKGKSWKGESKRHRLGPRQRLAQMRGLSCSRISCSFSLKKRNKFEENFSIFLGSSAVVTHSEPQMEMKRTSRSIMKPISLTFSSQVIPFGFHKASGRLRKALRPRPTEPGNRALLCTHTQPGDQNSR